MRVDFCCVLVAVAIRFVGIAAVENVPGNQSDIENYKSRIRTTEYAGCEARTAPDWLKRGFIYQINPRAFSPEGNLRGATARLSLVKDAGATIVYLMPVNVLSTATNHFSELVHKLGDPKGFYSPKDYFNAEPDFGTNEDRDAFVREVHRLGMKVIFDIVFYHCGWDACFLAVHPDYVKRNSDGTIVPGKWGRPVLNFDNPVAREYLYGVLMHLVKDVGVDGFRCDVSELIPIDFWEEAHRRLSSVKPEVVLLCEGYGCPGEQCAGFDACYDWPGMEALRGALDGRRKVSDIRREWKTKRTHCERKARFLRYLENHDETDASQNKGPRGDSDERWGCRLFEAGLFYCFTSDGIPFLFNGNEFADTSFQRMLLKTPVDWAQRDTTEGRRRLSFVRKFSALRMSDSAFSTDAEMVWLDNDAPDSVLSYERVSPDGSSRHLCIVNLSKHRVKVQVQNRGSFDLAPAEYLDRAVFTTSVEPLPNEKWWGATFNFGDRLPFAADEKKVDIGSCGGAAAPLLVSSEGRYVWSDRPFSFAFEKGVLKLESSFEKLSPTVAGKTLKSAYLAAAARHFPFTSTIPAELLFTKPQWNNWIEIAIQGTSQSTVDAYTEALAKSGFPCGVYMMDGGWLNRSGSFQFNRERFPDPKGMFARIHEKGWKSMIWISHFVAPEGGDFIRLRHGRGYTLDGLDVLAYSKFNDSCRSWPGKEAKAPGVIWWWSGISCTWDLTYQPGWDDYVSKLKRFAAEYGIDGYKFDAGDVKTLDDSLRFHDPEKRGCDFVHDYVRIGAEYFPYSEYRVAWGNGGQPFMLRLHDRHHSWKDLAGVSGYVQTCGLLGYPYVVADMVGGGEAGTFRPGSFFSEKLFVRSAALLSLHPMMQFSAAPWRYLSKENLEHCRAFAELHVQFAPYILELARHASKTGEPIVRSMEYEFPHQGFARPMVQFMLGSKWLVAPVVSEDDSVTVELPSGTWRDDLGETHIGPKKFTLKNVPLSRLPRYER